MIVHEENSILKYIHETKHMLIIYILVFLHTMSREKD